MLEGGIVAGCVVLGARWTRSLSTSGALAGFVAGVTTVAAGWSWGILLVTHFVSASILSKIGAPRKAELVGSVVEKDGERDARQVLANGGVFVAAALGFLLMPSASWYAIGLGALAASAADTWATEVGTLVGAKPVSIVSGQRVPPGTSGGITMTGSLAGLGGAQFIAAAATLAEWPVSFTAVVLGGIAGALTDSVLGGTLQERRWCDVCAEATERRVHDCGASTRHGGGMTRLDNDAVNLTCCTAGAIVTSLLS